MRPNIFLATIGRGSNGSNALEVTEDRAAVTAESQDNIINRVNNVSQYGPSWHYVPGIGVAGTAYAEVPGSALGDLAFTRASSKTRTNAAGVVETIGNNVPPHDYRNADGSLSTFPRLNLEPQRTNLMTYSEAFTNASWTKLATGSGTITVTDNYNISPAGTTTASRLVINNLGAAYVAKAFTSVNATLYTMSIWAKSNTSSSYTFQLRDGYSGSVSGNLTVTPTLQRFTFTFTASGTTAELQFRTIVLGSYDVSIWGAQLEAGAYPTTYIPTTTAAVTRIADTASKTGVSSLIGQTEGTLFVDITLTSRSSFSYFAIAPNLGFVTTYIGISIASSSISFEVVNSGIQVAYSFPNTSTGRFKLAFAYKANDFVAYVNGALVHTDTSGTVPTCSQIGLNAYNNAASWNYNEAALIKTRLTNAQLAQMTTL
jgi:hypothetical protein